MGEQTASIAALEHLINWCETSERESDEIDAAIEAIVDAPLIAAGVTPQRFRYSRSLDAALRLLPPDSDWRHLTHQSMSVYAANPYNANAQKRIDGMGATPPLQMCAAALRLRLEPLLKARAIDARKVAANG